MYAGKPGKFKKRPLSGVVAGNGLIEDWHRCVKHLSVSSRESQAHRLIDGSGGYWQSSGSQGKVRNLEIELKVLLNDNCKDMKSFINFGLGSRDMNIRQITKLWVLFASLYNKTLLAATNVKCRR